MRKAFLRERIREWFCAQEKLRAESFPVRNRLEQTGCYSSPDTSKRYDPDKKSQRTLVNFVDNRQFLCYNKPATWKKVFFFKNGELKSAAGGFKYFTSADIGSYWNNLNTELEAIPINESELP